jgi:hypothetical protein
MKSCPTCERTYADNSLNFCLKDGTPLKPLPSNETNSLSQPSHDAEATLIAPAPRNVSTSPPPADFYHSRPTPATPIPTNIPTLSSFTPPHISAAPDAHAQIPPQPPSSNRALIVGLTGMVAMLLLALSGVAYWLFIRSNDNQNDNARVIDNQNRTAPPVNNNRAVIVVNANVIPTPTPSPTLAPESVAAIK